MIGHLSHISRSSLQVCFLSAIDIAGDTTAAKDLDVRDGFVPGLRNSFIQGTETTGPATSLSAFLKALTN